MKSLCFRYFLLLVALVCFSGPFLAGCRQASQDPAKTGSLLDQVQARQKIFAGVKYDSKPFGYLDTDGTVKGFDVDLIREIAKRLLGSPDDVEFQQVLSSTRIMAIDSGSLDVVAATMTITPEREEIIDFSKPYYIAGQGIMVPRTSPVQALKDLQSKRVLFVMGTTSEGTIKKVLPQAKYIGFKTSTDAVGALKAGRGDALTTDDTILSGFMMDNCDFRLLKDRLSQEHYGLGFKQDVVHHSTDTFREKVNAILGDMEKDGTLERLKQKWVISDTLPSRCNP